MKSLTLAALLLGCSLAAAAQTGGSAPNQTPPASTPPTLPQEQTGTTPSSIPSGSLTMPPDTTARGETPSSANAHSTVSGCLERSAEGNFTLAHASGATYQLRGDETQLVPLIGNQVRVEGSSMASTSAGAMARPSSASGSAAGAERWLSVVRITKISDQCASTQNK